MLKDQVGTRHGEYLEWIGEFFRPFSSCAVRKEADSGGVIVIVLIAAEILVAAINIVVDLYAGVD